MGVPAMGGGRAFRTFAVAPYRRRLCLLWYCFAGAAIPNAK
ncbi:hypothetical protein [uncultured Treponema sp.]|nr:hypothetical protein [uncultured Treponema sp.]